MFTEHPLSGTMFSSGNSAVGRKPRPCFGRLHRVESVGKTDVDGGEMQDAVDVCGAGAKPVDPREAVAGSRASVGVKGCLKMNLVKIEEGSNSCWG